MKRWVDALHDRDALLGLIAVGVVASVIIRIFLDSPWGAIAFIFFLAILPVAGWLDGAHTGTNEGQSRMAVLIFVLVAFAFSAVRCVQVQP